MYTIDLSKSTVKWHEVSKKTIKSKVIYSDTNKIAINQLENQIHDLKFVLADRDNKINQFKNVELQLRNQINALRLELNNVREMYEKYKITNKKLYDDIFALNNEVSLLNNEVSLLNNTNSTLTTEISKFKNNAIQNTELQDKQKKTDIQNGMLIAKIMKIERENAEEKKKYMTSIIHTEEIIIQNQELFRENIELKTENELLKNKSKSIAEKNILLTKQLEKFVFDSFSLSDK
jgi:chromosome segregation ATPase